TRHGRHLGQCPRWCPPSAFRDTARAIDRSLPDPVSGVPGRTVTRAVERWFRDPSRFPPFARASLLLVRATVVVGALAPAPREADPGPRTVRPVQTLTTTTYGLPARDLAAAREAVAPTI